MKVALEFGDFDRYVLLQGLEYPIKNNQQIDAFFASHPLTEFLRAQNISAINNVKEEHKYRLYYNLDRAKHLCVKVLHKLNAMNVKSGHLLHLKTNYVVDCNGNQMDIYQGCAQFGLTQNAVKYIVEFHDKNSVVNRYFKSMYAPDEAYFHTILYNSSFVSNTVDGHGVYMPHLTNYENLTYFEYPIYVRLFKEISEWPVLRESGFLYFRKASSESKELLDYIDDIHADELTTEVEKEER